MLRIKSKEIMLARVHTENHHKKGDKCETIRENAKRTSAKTQINMQWANVQLCASEATQDDPPENHAAISRVFFREIYFLWWKQREGKKRENKITPDGARKVPSYTE